MTARREIEVKFPLDGPEAMREALLGLGAVFKGWHHEYNLRFDDAARMLTAQGIVLRLRRIKGAQGVRHILTHKAPVPDAALAFKILQECEVEVSDGETMRGILESLGYEVFWRYEKRREVYHWRRVEAVIDETPIGWFLELEGEPSGIRLLVDQLGLRMENAITAGYAELFRRVCVALALSVSDMTFDAFAGITVPPDACL